MTPDYWHSAEPLAYPPEFIPLLGGDLGPVFPSQDLHAVSEPWPWQIDIASLYAPFSPTIPPTQPHFQIFIDGVLRNDNVSIAQALTVEMGLNEWSRASFTCLSEDGTYRPSLNDEVVILDAQTGRRVFGGFIENPGEEHEDGTTLIWTHVVAVGYGSLLDRRAFAKHYDQQILWTPKSVVRDLLLTELADTGITLGYSEADGAVFTADIVMPWGYASDNIRRVLLEPSGLDFIVNENRELLIVSKTQGYGAAPFTLTDGDGNWDSNSMRVRTERGRYANRIILIPDIREPGMWTDTFIGGAGDFGNAGFYVTTYILNDKPAIYVNGQAMRVGEYWESAPDNDFVYAPGGIGVQSTGADYTGDTIEVVYPSPLQPAIVVQDDAEIAAFGSVVDGVEQVKDIYGRDRLIEVAQGILDRRKIRPLAVEYRTQEQGMRPGLLQTINTTEPLADATILVDRVSGSFQPTADGGFMRWSVSGSNSAVTATKSSVQRHIRIREALMRPQDRIRQIYAWDLAKTVDGMENPGVLLTDPITSDDLPRGEHRVSRYGYLYQARIRFETAPADKVVVDVFLTRGTDPPVSIFANGRLLEFAAADAGTQVASYNFTAQPFELLVDDILTATYTVADTTAKDGVLELEQQG